MVLEPLVPSPKHPQVPRLPYRITETISAILGETACESSQIEITTTEENAIPEDFGASTQVKFPSGLINLLGEPLNISTSNNDMRPEYGSNDSSDLSSVKHDCEIDDLWVGKADNGQSFAYVLAGTDEELQKKYGELIYDHTIHSSAITHLETEGKPKWGFLLVEKLPRWRKVVRGVVGFITLVGSTALLTPVVGGIPAVLIGAAAAIGVRKLLTLGRSVKFSAETAELKLTNGYAPKRDYDILQRLVREATDCTQSGVEVAVGTY